MPLSRSLPLWLLVRSRLRKSRLSAPILELLHP